MRPSHVMTSSDVYRYAAAVVERHLHGAIRSQVHGEHAAAGVALRRRTALFGVCCLLPLVRCPRRAMEGGTPR